MNEEDRNQVTEADVNADVLTLRQRQRVIAVREAREVLVARGAFGAVSGAASADDLVKVAEWITYGVGEDDV